MIKIQSKKKVIGTVSLALIAAGVSAQETSTTEAPIFLGPFDVTPTLEVDIQDDNNIFQAPSGAETSSTLTLIKPNIVAVADNDIVQYRIEYSLEDGGYSDTATSDYTDHSLVAGAIWRADVRHLIEFGSDIELGHDPRSADSVTGVNIANLNEFDRKQLSAKYTFGAEGADGRISVGISKTSVDYTTNRAFTDVLDSETQSIDLGFSLLVGADARALFQIVDTDIDFSNNSIRNRADRSYLVGAEWDFNEVIKGSARIGRVENDLLNQPGDTNRSTLEASIAWSPYEYSTWTLTASKEAANGDNNVGAFIDRSQMGLAWDHQWTDDLNMNITFSQQDDEYIGVNRSDELTSAQFRLTYALQRWLTIGLSLGTEDQKSSESLAQYDKNTTTLSLKASL